MFKISSFEQELMNEMSKQLVANQAENQHSFNKIAKAADYLNAAAEILDDTGLHAQAEVVTELLESLAEDDSAVTEILDTPVEGIPKHMVETVNGVEIVSIENLKKMLSDQMKYLNKIQLKELEKFFHSELRKLGVSPIGEKEVEVFEAEVGESDSNHLKNNKNKLVSNLKETGTVFSRKDFNRLDTDDFEEEA